MSDPNEQLTAVPDTELLQKIQQFNQPRIVGKLLHDLRNPVHSLRITVELFSRIAKAGAEAGKLLEKAGRYAAPAEGATIALATQVDRISKYLSPPRAPAIETLAIDAWTAEIAALLSESADRIEATIESSLPNDAAALADAPRLSHGVLHWALTRKRTCVVRASIRSDAVRLCIEGAASQRTHGDATSDAEVQRLIERAGGVCELNAGTMTIELRRSS